MKQAVAVLFLLQLGLMPTLFGGVAVKAGILHTMGGERIEDGVVLIESGKITAVGPSSRVEIPDGYEVISAQVVTPGLIDAHTVVGLAGALNQDHDQDQLENSSPIQPQLRAFDAYNPKERLVSWLRSFGVTTIHTGHGPGNLISGQTMVTKTVDDLGEERVLLPVASVAATLGSAATEAGKAPGTRSKAVAMLRAKLLAAQEYEQKQAAAEGAEKPARDLELESLVLVLRSQVPLLVTVDRATDILTALRLAEEFKIRLWLDGASEAYLVLDQIKESGFPVILHSTMARSFGEQENLSMTTAAKLQEAGIPFALQSGFESYVPKTRVVLFEAALAAGRSLNWEAALAAITIDAARILGVANRIGSIEVGKDADLALFDGDPFEYTTHVTGVLINGQKVSAGDADWR